MHDSVAINIEHWLINPCMNGLGEHLLDRRKPLPHCRNAIWDMKLFRLFRVKPPSPLKLGGIVHKAVHNGNRYKHRTVVSTIKIVSFCFLQKRNSRSHIGKAVQPNNHLMQNALLFEILNECPLRILRRQPASNRTHPLKV